jgi:hypothetical protein
VTKLAQFVHAEWKFCPLLKFKAAKEVMLLQLYHAESKFIPPLTLTASKVTIPDELNKSPQVDTKEVAVLRSKAGKEANEVHPDHAPSIIEAELKSSKGKEVRL